MAPPNKEDSQWLCCCGLFHIKTAGKIITVGQLLLMISGGGLFFVLFGGLPLMIIFPLLFIATIFAFFGIHVRKRCLMIPMLIVQVLACILLIVWAIFVTVVGAVGSELLQKLMKYLDQKMEAAAKNLGEDVPLEVVKANEEFLLGHLKWFTATFSILMFVYFAFQVWLTRSSFRCFAYLGAFNFEQTKKVESVPMTVQKTAPHPETIVVVNNPTPFAPPPAPPIVFPLETPVAPPLPPKMCLAPRSPEDKDNNNDVDQFAPFTPSFVC